MKKGNRQDIVRTIISTIIGSSHPQDARIAFQHFKQTSLPDSPNVKESYPSGEPRGTQIDEWKKLLGLL